MVQFRCRKHRAEEIQHLWQVAQTDDGKTAARPIAGSFKHGGQRPGGWIHEDRPLAPGLYCQQCLRDGDLTPLSDYEIDDLRDAGLIEVPHIGLLAADFDVDAAWAGMAEQFGSLAVAEHDRPACPAKTDDAILVDEALDAGLKRSLNRLLDGGSLYTHQAKAIRSAIDGLDVVIETATASGKSLCYWAPILNESLRSPATALYLAPLNALGEDQLRAVDRLGEESTSHWRPGTLDQFSRKVKVGSHSVLVSRYDSSISSGLRRTIRNSNSQVIITNPDMLHRGILPHHKQLWQSLFANLQFIVLDELHVYKGMFGAHVANVIRRVLRIAAHYGQRPQIIGCSASIGNPGELFSALTGRCEPVIVRASENGAPLQRQKRVILDAGRSQDAMSTLAKDLMLHTVGGYRARTLTFMRSISEVDQVFRYVSGELARKIKGISKRTVREYKREIPSDEKARVTSDLKNGATLGVISTTALQLGIDIGDLSVCIICKFPGSKAAFFQQAGRVGRTGESLVLLVADESPLDHHYVLRPEELLEGPAEVVFLNPDHRDTVLNHLRCAAEELPLDPIRDAAFWGEQIHELIADLATMENMRADGREVLVIGRAGKVASEINIRSLGFECAVRDEQGNEVARPDVLRAMRRYHKYARFQIQEQAYEVVSLRIKWDTKQAEATAKQLDRLDYTTASVVKTECDIIKTDHSQLLADGTRFERGAVRFTAHVDGYYRIPSSGSGDPEYQHLGPAAPPKHELDTEGLWFSLSPAMFAEIGSEDHFGAANSAIESLRLAAALLCSTDPDDIGSHIDDKAPPHHYRVYLADSSAGGDGLTEQVYDRIVELINGAIRILRDCPHCNSRPGSRGCARCVTSPWGNEQAVCRSGGITLLQRLRDQVSPGSGIQAQTPEAASCDDAYF